MDDEEETPAELELFAEVVNGLAGKATEAVILLQTGDPLLAAAMGGGAGGTAKGLVLAGARRLFLRRRDNLHEAFAAAEDESGRTPQELFEHALDQDDERRLDLFVDAFSAAAQSADRRKVRAFGRIVASGILAEDDAKVDETSRVFATLAGLDEADLKALIAMGREPFEGWLVEAPQSNSPAKVFRRDMPELGDVTDAVVSRLEGGGLISTGRGEGLSFGAEPYRLTRFGTRCFEELMRGEDAGT